MLDQIKDNLKQAQLKKDEIRVSTLRALISEITYSRIQKGEELTDADIVAVVQKELKKRREAAEGFRKGDRIESAEKEEAEGKILEEYLPAQMSDEELTKIVEDSITELEAKTMADMGKVIGKVKEKVEARAEGARISAIVKVKLTA